MTIRAVLFDVGETLVHPAPSFPALFSQVLEREGHARDEADVLAASSVVLERFSEASREREAWTLSPEASRAFWIDVYQRMLVSLDLPSANGLRETLYAAFTDLDNYALFDDVLPALASLREQGVAAGIVSNFEAWLEDLLGASGDPERVPGPGDQRPGGDGETRSSRSMPWRWSVSDCRRIRWRSWGTIPSSTSFRRWPLG